MREVNPLNFSSLDDITFTIGSGKEEALNQYIFVPDDLGSLMELLHLSRCRRLPMPEHIEWLSLEKYEDLYRNLKDRHLQTWISHQKDCGFFRVSEVYPEEGLAWTQFGLTAQKAAVIQGFSAKIAAQLIGALGELYSNIYEHSGFPASGLVAFNVRDRNFEFVIADLGIGVLESLRSGDEFKNLSDAGEALELILKEGISRFGKDVDRGYGFRPLFQGLANLNGYLRFRSENQALILNGMNAASMPTYTSEKISMKGFFISVSCGI